MINVFYIFPRNFHFSLFNGSFYYILEYFLFLYVKNVDINLFLLDNKNNNIKAEFKEYFNTKYNIPFPENNIHSMRIIDLFNIKKAEQNIVDIETYSNPFIKKYIGDNQIHLIYTARYKEFLNEDMNKKNIFHYNENQEYNKKIYFEILKKPKISKKYSFMSLKEMRAVNIEQFDNRIYPYLKIISQNRKTKILLDKNSRLSLHLKQYDDIICFYEAINNLFEEFDIYIDCMLNNFDYSPRMMLESYYLNKKVFYITNNKNDNALKRYNDIMSGNIMKYNLDENDVLIRRCLNNV